jgi:hypothetical protein
MLPIRRSSYSRCLPIRSVTQFMVILVMLLQENTVNALSFLEQSATL